jgi:hypothetical protein
MAWGLLVQPQPPSTQIADFSVRDAEPIVCYADLQISGVLNE